MPRIASVFLLLFTSCTSSETPQIATPVSRYDVAKVRETRNQIEFYVIDKQTGRICVTVAKVGTPPTSAETPEDFATCLPVPTAGTSVR